LKEKYDGVRYGEGYHPSSQLGVRGRECCESCDQQFLCILCVSWYFLEHINTDFCVKSRTEYSTTVYPSYEIGTKNASQRE